MLEKLKTETSQLQKEVRTRTVGYILTALGLVAGLAWNETVKAFIEYFIPVQQNSILAKLIYAIVITLAVVTVSTYLLRIAGEEQKP